MTAASLTGCASNDHDSTTESSTDLTLNNAAWSYDADNDVDYQMGITYVSDPGAPEIEQLAAYVPGVYLDASDNGDGTFTGKIDTAGKSGNYTAARLCV